MGWRRPPSDSVVARPTPPPCLAMRGEGTTRPRRCRRMAPRREASAAAIEWFALLALLLTVPSDALPQTKRKKKTKRAAEEAEEEGVVGCPTIHPSHSLH